MLTFSQDDDIQVFICGDEEFLKEYLMNSAVLMYPEVGKN